MKIHAEKIENGPPHGLCAKDVRCILAMVPPAWVKGLTEVRLANGNGPKAYVFPSQGRLLIYSRGGTQRQTLIAVLSALAAPCLHITNCVSRGPSGPEQRRLDTLIQPLVDVLLSEMTPLRKQGHESRTPWKPLTFPNEDA